MSFWSRQSIAVKLPLAFAFVLLILGTAMGVVSYLEVRQTVVDIASQRLEQAASQMATMLGALWPPAHRRHAATDATRRHHRVPAHARRRPCRLDRGVDSQVPRAPPPRSRTLNCGIPPAVDCSRPAPSSTLRTTRRTPATSRSSPPRRRSGGCVWSATALLYPVGGRVEQNGETLGYVIERRRIVKPCADPADHQPALRPDWQRGHHRGGQQRRLRVDGFVQGGFGRADYTGRERSAARV